MKKLCRTMLISIIISTICMNSIFAMTSADLKEAHVSDYTAGTNSVYGPALTQEQLDKVAQYVSDFMNVAITPDMSDEQKIREAHNYMFRNVIYAETWSKNSANTAYGALVNHAAQCSGYARAFKALCDAMGIECYYVHADATAFSPEHQWNIVKYEGQYYHMDTQLNCLGKGGDTWYLTSTHPCTYDYGAYPQIANEDAPVKRYYAGEGPYVENSQEFTIYEFPGPEKINIDMETDYPESIEYLEYGFCNVLKLPKDVDSIYITEDSPYDESLYSMQIAIIPYKGAESRQEGKLVPDLPDGYLRNFQDIKKGVPVNIDPLGENRSAAEIAGYCRDHDIFFELYIFDEKAYWKYEREHGEVALENLIMDIPGMFVLVTY